MQKIWKLTLYLALQAAFLFVSGSDLDEGYGHYSDYPMDQPPFGYEGQPAGNQTLTVGEAEHMIKQAIKDARHQVLTDPELEGLIKVKIEGFLNAKRDCTKKEDHYFDYGVPDCKSCLRENCVADALCETECREFLKRRETKQEVENIGQGLDAIKSDVKDLQDSQYAQADQTWKIILAVVTGIVAVMAAISLYLVITRTTRATGTERLTRTSHPLSDLSAELRRLLGFGKGAAGNDEGADGNQA